MPYWRYPQKQKSPRTIERNDALEKYNKIVSYTKLENLKNNNLLKQKKLYEEEMDLIRNKFSIKNYKANIYEFQNYTKKLKNIIGKLKDLCKKGSSQFIIKKSYYKQKAFFFPAQVIIQHVRFPKDRLKKIILHEEILYKELENKKLKKFKDYFCTAYERIKQHYLIYNLEIFKDNNMSWEYNADHSKNIFYSMYYFDKDVIEPITFGDDINNFINKTHDNTDEMTYVHTPEIFSPSNQNITFKEYIKNNKIPTYDEAVSFSKFNECSKSDFNEKNRDILLRFNETGYDYECSKNLNVKKYHKSISEKKYTPGTLIDIKFFESYSNKADEAISRILRKIELLLRSRTKQTEKFENVGFVYVLKSVGYPNLYKIGSTYGLAEERAEELSGTNVPDPWKVAAKIKIKDAEYYEKSIHKLLKKYRYRKDREFFKLDLKMVKSYLKQIFELTDGGVKKLTLSTLQKKMKI